MWTGPWTGIPIPSFRPRTVAWRVTSAPVIHFIFGTRNTQMYFRVISFRGFRIIILFFLSASFFPSSLLPLTAVATFMNKVIDEFHNKLTQLTDA